MLIIGICDSDTAVRVMLADFIKRYKSETGLAVQVLAYDNGEKLLQHYSFEMDLIFLEISFAKMSGIEIAKGIRKVDNKVGIVFLTTLLNHVLEAYEVRADNYLIKPLKYSRFLKEVEEARARKGQNRFFIEANANGIYKIYTQSIRFIETQEHNTRIHTESDSIVSYKRMKDHEAALYEPYFVRCHAGYRARAIYQNPVLGLGTFTLVFTLSGQLQNTAGECLVDIMVLAQNIPYMQEFFYLDKLEREVCSADSREEGTGEITFENVSFAYPNSDNKVLQDINLRIREGEKIAVVGENGSGKSTFISLLCGMFDPLTGRIRVGGADVGSHPAAARKAVSVVFQDFAHYETSIRENITISDKHRNAADQEIMELLQKINVDDVVKEQKNGLHELVGSFSEKANNLSGGQWQKISLARAAYRNKAKIMILDEPTSALDPVAEARLYHNFTALTEDKTTILISHRLGITSVVDRILVFKEGRIIEDGSHKELMAKKGYYAQMYHAQAQWYV